MIAGAAMAGLFSGTAVRVQAATTSGTNVNAGASMHQMDAPDKHSCKGQNACKGQGGCKSGDNGCKGKNSCKGKGGCATDGKKGD